MDILKPAFPGGLRFLWHFLIATKHKEPSGYLTVITKEVHFSIFTFLMPFLLKTYFFKLRELTVSPWATVWKQLLQVKPDQLVPLDFCAVLLFSQLLKLCVDLSCHSWFSHGLIRVLKAVVEMCCLGSEEMSLNNQTQTHFSHSLTGNTLLCLYYLRHVFAVLCFWECSEQRLLP